jgi:hypothetical protein
MQPVEIEIVGVVELFTQKVSIMYLSDLAPSASALEWWIAEDGSHHVLYWQESFYNDKLRNRRNSGNMISPKDPRLRLFKVGKIRQHVDLAPGSYIEIFGKRIQLPAVILQGVQ